MMALRKNHAYPVRPKNTTSGSPIFVMAGLVPAIHVFDLVLDKGVDARHKAGHDGSI
jgi:hypothetical protein